MAGAASRQSRDRRGAGSFREVDERLPVVAPIGPIRKPALPAQFRDKRL
jgi:hypothetical protein